MIIKNVNLETVCGITSKLPENDKMCIRDRSVVTAIGSLMASTSPVLLL